MLGLGAVCAVINKGSLEALFSTNFWKPPNDGMLHLLKNWNDSENNVQLFTFSAAYYIYLIASVLSFK